MLKCLSPLVDPALTAVRITSGWRGNVHLSRAAQAYPKQNAVVSALDLQKDPLLKPTW